MQKVFTCITVLICLYIPFVAAQSLNVKTSTTLQALQPGDKVPDLVLNNLYNYGNTRTSIGAFKGKLLLLDFWSTSCATCIKKMDHLQHMQEQYPEKLQVLLVAKQARYDSPERIDALYSRIKDDAGKRYKLPVVTKDTSLSKLFPSINLPHIVWINSQQRVIAITGGEAVTDENIQAVIAGKLPNFILKEDQADFNPAMGLFKNGNGGSGNNFLYRSIVTPNVSGIPSASSMEKDKTGNVTRLTFANSGLLFLINLSYGSDLALSHIDFTKAGEGIDYRDRDDQWWIDYTFCYDLTIPPTPYPAAMRLIQDDLKRYFGLMAVQEEKVVPCYILTADTVKLSRFKSTQTTAINELFEKNGKRLQHSPVSALSNYLDAVLTTPVVDETHCSFPVDLSLPDEKPLDIDALNTALNKYGLQLLPAERKLPILTIFHQSIKQ
ncbi:MAG: redoxin family protein [Ferruginibacter sp.]